MTRERIVRRGRSIASLVVQRMRQRWDINIARRLLTQVQRRGWRPRRLASVDQRDLDSARIAKIGSSPCLVAALALLSWQSYVFSPLHSGPPHFVGCF